MIIQRLARCAVLSISYACSFDQNQSREKVTGNIYFSAKEAEWYAGGNLSVQHHLLREGERKGEGERDKASRYRYRECIYKRMICTPAHRHVHGACHDLIERAARVILDYYPQTIGRAIDKTLT